MTHAVARARDAFIRRAWREAHREYGRADRESGLGIDDLERLATAAYLIDADDAADAWERAYRRCLDDGDRPRAAREAFWLAQHLIGRGDLALGGGWLARAAEALGDIDSVERGYLLIPEAMQKFGGGDLAGSSRLFESAYAIAERFGDTDLASLSRMGRGQALVALGDQAGARASLDAAMVAVCAGDVSPIVAGFVYCGVIEACHEMFDLRRAREWTGALSRWCDEQPELVPYRGQCLVHRAEIMELDGDWPRALDEARRACDRLTGDPALGAALYRMAELHRLHGALAEAEDAYRAASRAGREPQPGLALLRLAQGNRAAAEAAIRRVVDETTGDAARARLLGPYVDIMLAAGRNDDARSAAGELSEIAARVGAPFVRAVAQHATGAVMLADSKAVDALPMLRAAWAAWRDVGSPYQAARVRVLLGLACRALGDADGAEMEFDAARLGLERLGARTELNRLAAAVGDGAGRHPGGLTDRELEVLVLVAQGLTNRDIGSALVVSEHTVARHLQNIFAKLGVSSRTAAGSFAHQRGLV